MGYNIKSKLKRNEGVVYQVFEGDFLLFPNIQREEVTGNTNRENSNDKSNFNFLSGALSE